MNVASLELCKELYELSEWKGELFWTPSSINTSPEINDVSYDVLAWDKITNRYNTDRVMQISLSVPAYDLGYLLRKLEDITTDVDLWDRAMDCSPPDSIFVAYNFDAHLPKWRVQMQIEEEVLECTLFEADTPEDALCKLAIELFKQGILTKETPQS